MDKRRVLEAKRKWIMAVNDMKVVNEANKKRTDLEKDAAWSIEHVNAIEKRIEDCYIDYIKILNEEKGNK